MSVDHYENFPVASVLVPRQWREAIEAIYRFARTADDIADEGIASDAQRLAELAALNRELDAIESNAPTQWPALAAAVQQHGLPIEALRDLLSAFSQDVQVKRYADEAALLDYCRRSANPIGRLLLALYRRTDASSLAQSDAICTALQLINFWQDVAIDWRKDRVYIPQSALLRFGVHEAQISEQRVDAAWTALLQALTSNASAMLKSGAPLARTLGGRVGFELRLVVQGGLRIAERIERVDGDVFRARPTLGKFDWALMLFRALRM
jgi:squalene synthase HpnC